MDKVRAVRFNEQLDLKIAEIAESEKRSVSFTIRRICQEYVDALLKPKKKTRKRRTKTTESAEVLPALSQNKGEPKDSHKFRLLFEKAYINSRNTQYRWGAKDYGMANSIIKDVGIDTALKLAAYYPHHPRAKYIDKGHSLYMLKANLPEIILAMENPDKVYEGAVAYQRERSLARDYHDSSEEAFNATRLKKRREIDIAAKHAEQEIARKKQAKDQYDYEQRQLEQEQLQIEASQEL